MQVGRILRVSSRLPILQVSNLCLASRCNMATQFQPIVLCGPSGSGKSTIVKKLMGEYDGCFAFSVSHTTRKPRPGEEHGKDYFFSERADMEKMIENKEFIETAEFSGNLYGTSIKAVQDVQATGKICILDVDMQGVKAIKKTDLNPRYIFMKPPSEEVLEQRLRGRGTENEDSLQKRLARAKAELEFGATPGVFDNTVVNDNLEHAYQNMKDILIKDLEAIKGRSTGAHNPARRYMMMAIPGVLAAVIFAIWKLRQ